MNHTTFGKILLFSLALGTPVWVYKGFSDQQELLRYRENVLATHLEERDRIIGDVATRFFRAKTLQDDVVLKRDLPLGPLQGLTEIPPPSALDDLFKIRSSTQSTGDPAFIRLLHSAEVFPSGLPHRYAGFIELVLHGECTLSDSDYQRFQTVAIEFWKAEGLDNNTYRFLLKKLSTDIRCNFTEQMRFLGMDLPDSPNRFLVYFQSEQIGYLLEPSLDRLEELNRRLAAFLPGFMLVKDSIWRDWNGIRLTLRADQSASVAPLQRTGWLYGSALCGVELTLALIYWVLVRFEQINRTQKRLLATTSHELRTPLAVIRQFAEMLLDRSDQVPDRIAKYHHHIHQESLKMQFLVENLLSAARFEHLSLKPSFVQIDLNTWLRQLTDVAASLTSQTVDYQGMDCTVFWDRDLISQVIANICENARIHAESDLHVNVLKLKDQVELSFRDFGPNPNLKELAKLAAFKSTGKRGLGLGLFLSERIISAHGGTLRFELANPGLRVVLTLPYDCRARSQNNPPREEVSL